MDVGSAIAVRTRTLTSHFLMLPTCIPFVWLSTRLLDDRPTLTPGFPFYSSLQSFAPKCNHAYAVTRYEPINRREAFAIQPGLTFSSLAFLAVPERLASIGTLPSSAIPEQY
jgi:hypothetical protein